MRPSLLLKGMTWNDAGYVSTYLTSQRTGILQSLVNLTLLQVILWFLSFHLLVKLLLVLHLLGWDLCHS